MSEGARRETWEAWLPPGMPEPSLKTRAQLMSELHTRCPDVAERTLRDWERRGLLPHPVRRSHEGRVQALYPRWFAEAVITIRSFRERNLSPDQILPHARALFWTIAAFYADGPFEGAFPVTWSQEPMRPAPVITDGLDAALQALLLANDAHVVELRVLTADGRVYEYARGVQPIRRPTGIEEVSYE